MTHLINIITPDRIILITNKLICLHDLMIYCMRDAYKQN